MTSRPPRRAGQSVPGRRRSPDRTDAEADSAAAPSISLVIAAYNEAETLAPVFQRSLAVLQECCRDFEIIILDDASTDDTAAIAERLRQRRPDVVRVLAHRVNQGIARTFEDLYRAAEKEYIFDVPADGEYPPEALRDILPLLDRFDAVVCRRTFKNYSLYRRVVSYFYRKLPRWLFGVELYDPGSTKVRPREWIEEIGVTSRGVFVEAERLVRAARRGYRIGKVDVAPERRLAGDPRGASAANVASALLDLAALWVRLVLLRQPP